MKIKNNFYFKMLKYAADRISTGFTLEQITKDLNINYDHNPIHTVIYNNYKDVLFHNSNKRASDKPDSYLYFINPEAYFKYISLVELKQARNASIVATLLSLSAIFIAVITLFKMS